MTSVLLIGDDTTLRSKKMPFKRHELRALSPGEEICSGGIRYTKLEGDGRWTINVMVQGRRYHRNIGLDSEGVTYSQVLDAVTRLRSGILDVLPKRRASKGVPTLSEASQAYLEFLRSHGGKNLESKEAHLRLHLLPAMGRVRLDAITEEEWLKYLVARQASGAQPGTINRERATLIHLLRTAVRRKQIPAVPCAFDRLREPPGKLVFLSPDQLERLLEAAEVDQCPSVHAFIMIGAFTGMRQEAILRIRVRDIDTVRRIIRVQRDKAGARDQPMPTRLATYLGEKIEGLLPSDYLFKSSRSKAGRVYQMNTQLARCVKRAGLPPDVTPHALRHTMATNAAQAGVDPATNQGMGGWKTRAMVDRYTHAQSLAMGMDKLEAHYAQTLPRTGK